MLEQELQRIGLSEKEAKVYLASLELGPSPVQKIAAKAHVNRATTYVILEGLMKKGIITIYDQGKKRYFVAEGPNSLKNIISQQQKELDEKEKLLEALHSQLQSVYNVLPNKPVVKFYDGKEGLKSIQQEFLEHSNTEAKLIYAPREVDTLFTPQERQEHRKKRIAKKIFTKQIYCEDEGKKVSMEFAELKRVPAKKYKFTSDVTIIQDKVMFASLTGHVSGVTIQSKSIADTLSALFDLAYQAAEQYNNEYESSPAGKDSKVSDQTL